MKALLLVGGSGTRLWPLSRGTFPKQFLKFNSPSSFFSQTIQRLLAVFAPTDIVIVGGADYTWQIASEIAGTGIRHVVYEPCARNTAPALALGCRYCTDVLGVTGEEVVFAFPSDHLIRDTEAFAIALGKAKEAAQRGALVILGVEAHLPETGYGYIEADMAGGANGIYPIKRFVEKPNEEQARAYLQIGNFFWNSGISAFKVTSFFEQLGKHCPAIGRFANTYEELLDNFVTLPSISYDYAVLEKALGVSMIPLQAGWNDIGSWNSLYEEMEKDEQGNVVSGDVVAFDVKNSLLIGAGRLVSAVGIEDMVVVGASDVTLVVERKNTQSVRSLVEALSTAGRKEAVEAPKAKRPWGVYTILETGVGYKVKHIEIIPGAKISLQVHRHRSEHWVIIGGKAKVRVGEEENIAQVGQSFYVPVGVLHRLENIGEETLQIIEVQSGAYLDENDIVRFDDEFGRS